MKEEANLLARAATGDTESSPKVKGIATSGSANAPMPLAGQDDHKNVKESSVEMLVPMVVREEQLDGLTTPSLFESRLNLDKVPGGTTLVDGDRMREGANYDVSDLLSFAPGVYVGSGSGVPGGPSRISIRGSDINSPISPILGMKVLRDGLPLTNANGATDTEQMNLYPVAYTEIYRGANALVYGASNLGGAINLVSKTGRTDWPLQARMIFGNDEFVNLNASAGTELGKGGDAFGAFSYLTSNGFRKFQEAERFLGYGNIGYRWNDSNETRLHFDIQDHEFIAPFALTQQQLEDDPSQSTRPFRGKDAGFPVYRVDLHHTLLIEDDNRLDMGAYYQRKDFTFGTVEQFRDLWEDAGFSWRHDSKFNPWGYSNQLVWGGLFQWMWVDDRNFSMVDRQRGPLTFHEKDHIFNMEIFVEDQFNVTESLTLVLGAQWAYRHHETKDIFSGSPTAGNKEEKSFFGFNPKGGFVWHATESMQIFGNVSRSFQPPGLTNLQNFSQQPSLKKQTATTIELGMRGQMPFLQWDLTVYHAWLNNELLIVRIPPEFVDFTTGNAEDTLHTGIELGLESTLPLGWFGSHDQLRMRGTYTWNDFRFDNDRDFGDNQLPGIPEHVGRFELLYQHPFGFSIGPNIQAASTNFVDFANTLKANSYVLLGARLSYAFNQHYRLFVDARNLTNEAYAASVFVTGDAEGQDLAQFNPGPTRQIFGGVELQF
ncbi:MAG: TonB-dependent receptor [Methylothermaceae bacterium]|nr:TonB-dependent receptor [Methylothermaceae bacterium]